MVRQESTKKDGGGHFMTLCDDSVRVSLPICSLVRCINKKQEKLASSFRFSLQEIDKCMFIFMCHLCYAYSSRANS